MAEVDGAQAREAVQRAPLQLRQPVLAQVKLLQAHHVHEAPLEKEGNSTELGESTTEYVKVRGSLFSQLSQVCQISAEGSTYSFDSHSSYAIKQV